MNEEQLSHGDGGGDGLSSELLTTRIRAPCRDPQPWSSLCDQGRKSSEVQMRNIS